MKIFAFIFTLFIICFIFMQNYSITFIYIQWPHDVFGNFIHSSTCLNVLKKNNNTIFIYISIRIFSSKMLIKFQMMKQ